MATIRRSGGSLAMYWQGKLIDPRTAEFAAALQQQRFRTIESAASEEVSIGWVTANDPTGEHFAPDDLEAGTATWLRMRVDRKQLPHKWLQIHRDAAQRARGRKLSARERREIKDDLLDKLLPRVLPTVNFVDALLFADRRTVLLLHSGKSVTEQFSKLFFATFALPLERADPLLCAQRGGLDEELRRRLDRLEPVRWPVRDQPPGPRAATIHAVSTAEAEDA